MYKIFFYSFISVFFIVSCSSGNEEDRIPSNEIGTPYEPQLNFLNKAIEEDPGNAELYYKRGRVYNNMFLYTSAITDINKAIKIEPEKNEYYFLLADVLLNANNVFEAIKAAERAESLGCSDPELKVLMARLYWTIKDTIRVVQYINQANALIPYNSDLALLGGQMALYRKDTMAAIHAFKKSMSRDKGNIKPYREIIKIFDASRNDDTLMSYLIKARELKPNDATLFFYEGKFLQRRGLTTSAKLAYQSVLKYDSSYFQVYYQLGYMDYQKADFPEAYKNFNTYVKHNNEDVNIYKKLIEISQRQGNDAATIPFYERLIVLDTNNVSAKYILERLYKLYASNKTVEAASKKDSLMVRSSAKSIADSAINRRRTYIRKTIDSSVVRKASSDSSSNR